jgi:hypothetical protein
MSHMDGVWGWGGWQWMFLLEGLPTALLGVACCFLLTDAPRNAKWLTGREKAVVEAILNADQGEAMATGHITATAGIMRGMGDARVWIWPSCTLPRHARTTRLRSGYRRW